MTLRADGARRRVVDVAMLLQLVRPLRLFLLSSLVFASSAAECADENADCPNCALLRTPPQPPARHSLPLGSVTTDPYAL